jgi:REP element-mobilizing transposase RayT
MPGYFWQYRPSRNARLSPEMYTTVGRPVFFTIRAVHATSPFARPELADITVTCLLEQRSKSSCEVPVYCIMPDHVHAAVTPALQGASSLTFVDRFKGWCGRECHLAGWEGKLWQPRSYDHVVREDEDLLKIAVYILHNPVRRGLVTAPAEYRWAGIPDAIFTDIPHSDLCAENEVIWRREIDGLKP